MTRFTVDQIVTFVAQHPSPPLCPFCHDAMVRVHVQCHDDSGWVHGWFCDCEPLDQYPRDTADFYSEPPDKHITFGGDEQ